jgi:hypothetical protein
LPATPVDVKFGVQLSGVVHGVSDAAGFLEVGDVTAILLVDGVPVLFDLTSLPGLPSTPGINNYQEMTVPITGPLTATVPLDTNSLHFFLLRADAEAQAHNIAEPGSLALLLAGLGALAWTCRARPMLLPKQHGASRRS